MSNNTILTILFLAGVILTIGDIFFKKWAISNTLEYYAYGMFFWLIGANMLAYTFKFKDIAIASVIYVIFNVVTLMFVGWYFFGEQITSTKIIGVTLALISITILSI